MSKLYSRYMLPLILKAQRIPFRRALQECRELNSKARAELEDYQLRELKRLIQNHPLVSDDQKIMVAKSNSLAEALRGIPTTAKKNLLLLKPPRKNGLIVRETTGTTGTPLMFWYSKNHIARQLAVRAWCFERLGITYGEREARLWGRRDFGIGSRVKNLLLNRKVFNFLDGDRDRLIKSLRAYKPSYIYGYSSMVLEVAKYLDQKGIEPPPIKAVICTAENLQPFQQDYIERVFDCPVVMEYGCTEVDIIGFQCPQRHYHLVNPWLIVETDKNCTVVTDLSQKLMPIVRYEVGDDVLYGKIKSACLGFEGNIVLESVVGRSIGQTVYLPNKRTKHAVVFAYLAEDLYKRWPNFSKFLVVQKTLDSFVFHLEVASNPDDDTKVMIERFVHDTFFDLTNEKVTFEINCVEALPVSTEYKFNYFFSEVAA